MVKCPKCGSEVSEPDKSLKTRAFTVERFTCPNCHTRFKVTS